MLNTEADPRVYFAAERTLLAWIRTGMTIMAFGFVVARFGLFLRLLRAEDGTAVANGGVSPYVGVGARPHRRRRHLGGNQALPGVLPAARPERAPIAPRRGAPPDHGLVAGGAGSRAGRHPADVTRSRIFSKRFPVPPEAIDVQGHVNNLAYVGWMQDVAIEHSTAAGWSMQRYLELGAGWVVRSHFVEYFRPAFADEIVSVHTWVPAIRPAAPPLAAICSCVRLIESSWRGAETIWVFVDLTTGRRRPIPPELLAAFEPVPEEIEVRRTLGLAT